MVNTSVTLRKSLAAAKKVTNQLAYRSLVIASSIAVNFYNACSFAKNNFPLCIACNRGGVVAFIGEGQVGSFTEDKLLGDRDLDLIVQVCWSEKELFDARLQFFGKYLKTIAS